MELLALAAAGVFAWLALRQQGGAGVPAPATGPRVPADQGDRNGTATGSTDGSLPVIDRWGNFVAVLPVVAAPPTNYYSVAPGDSLSGIAATYGWSWQQLWRWADNQSRVPNPNLIYPGQVIAVPFLDQSGSFVP